MAHSMHLSDISDTWDLLDQISHRNAYPEDRLSTSSKVNHLYLWYLR